MKASRIITGCVIAAAIVAVAVLGTRWGLSQTVSADPVGSVALVHVEPDGSEFTGNPYCPQTVWDNGVPITVEPWDDCNNITSQKHVIRSEGWDPATMAVVSWNLENFSGAAAAILAEGRCGDLAEVTGRAEWNPANDDEQCVVIHSSTPGETRVTLTYDEDGFIIITDAVIKEWDKLLDTVILKADDVESVSVPGIGSVELPKDANNNGVRDATDARLLDHNGETQDHALVWDEARKRLKSSLGPIRLIEVVHGYHAAMPDHPTEGAVILAFIDSPMGCTYFTNPVPAVIGMGIYQPGELDLGTAQVGISDWRGFFIGPRQWPPSAQLSAEALAEAAAHLLAPPMSNNSYVIGAAFFEADYAGVYVDTVCEEQATITFKVGYPDYVQSVPEIPEIEQVTINWTAVELAKQPQIRWAGEEIVLEKRWALPGEWFPEAGGIDDDLDGFVNEDSGHVSTDDQDGDGLVDEDGLTGETSGETGLPMTSGVDDDGDQKEDGSRGDPGIFECTDGIDNDGDTKTDAADPNCNVGVGVDEDVADDDGDGLIDEDPLDICPLAGYSVQYIKLDGPGGLVGGPDSVWTYIDEECISRALYSSEEQGPVDVEALVYDPGSGEVTNKHAFLVWYLKVYQVKLTNVPGERDHHNDGEFAVGEGADLYDPSVGDSEAETLNASQDALLRVRVKGWFYGGDLSGNSEVLASGRGDVCLDMDGDGDGAGSEPGEPYPAVPAVGCPDPDDQLLLHGHWVLPDDLPLLAGPHPDRVATWDVMSEPDVAATDIIGPKSTLDSHDDTLRQVVPCVKPKTVGGVVVPDFTCTRKTIDPDGAITEADALMPPLKILAQLGADDTGFLKPAAKSADVGIDSAYQSVMIPANAEIPPMVNNGGYAWDSWGWNVVQYAYPFFWELTKTTQDGFIRSFEFYTDNRGEGFFFANGDYNLSFDDCRTDPVSGAPDCRPRDVVGESTITVIGDYPYFRKHSAVLSNPVVKTWEWGGDKKVASVRVDATHIYIIAHLKDRDGFCKWDVDYPDVTTSPSLNPVQLEEIEFTLNTEVGSILNVSSNGVYNPAAPHAPLTDATVIGADSAPFLSAGRDSAIALAEDVRVLAGLEDEGLVDVGARGVDDGPVPEDACQAWVLIEHPIDQEPDVSIVFHNPEGVITRHWPPSTREFRLVGGPSADGMPPLWNDSCYIGPTANIVDALGDDVLCPAGLEPTVGEDGELACDETGAVQVLAVYRLKADQNWDTWFPEDPAGESEPVLSTMTELNPYDQLLILMSDNAWWEQEVTTDPKAERVELVNLWNSVCYAGGSKSPGEATSAIADDFSILLTYGADQWWRRYMPNPAWVNNIVSLNQFTSVLMLVTADGGTTWVFDPPATPVGPTSAQPSVGGGTEDAQTSLSSLPNSAEFCAPVIPGTYYGTVTIDGQPTADGTTIGAIIDGIVWASTTTSGGRYVFEVPAGMPVSPPCFEGGTLTFTCDGVTAAESDTWAAGPHELDLTCGELPPEVTVRVDQGISIEALAVPAPGLGAFTIDATYDPSALTLAECTADPEGSFEMALCNSEFGPNTIRATGIRPECGLTGNVPLAEMTFEPTDAVCPDDLLVSVETLADCDGNDIAGAVDHKWWVGDADRDFDKDVVDAMFVLQYVVGLRGGSDECPPPPGAIHLPSADTDCDGDVDVVDAMFVLQHVVGLRPVLCPPEPDISGTWLLYMTPQGEAESGPDCFYVHQEGSHIYYSMWQHEFAASVSGTVTGGTLELSGDGMYYGHAISFSASATTDGNTISGTYSYTGAYSESGTWRTERGECKKAKGWVRTVHIQNQGYGLDFYIWDLIPEGITFSSADVTGPHIGTISLHSGGPTEYYPWISHGGPFLGETMPTAGDVYTFTVNYSDGTSETVTASVRDTLVGFPTPISPADGEVVDTLTPTFSWQPPACECQGYYRIWVVDSEGNDMWSVYVPKETTSVVYNSDERGTPLSTGETYEWRLIAFDEPISGGPDNNVWVLSSFTVQTDTP